MIRRDGRGVRRRRRRLGIRRRDRGLPAGRSRAARLRARARAALRAGDFADEPARAPELLWHERLNPDGLFDVRCMRDVAVITAAGVGGGSLVYANVQLRAPADGLRARTGRRRSPARSSTPGTTAPRRRCDPRHDARRTRRCRRSGLRGRRANSVGHEAEPLPIAVHFGEARAHPFSGVRSGGLPEPRPLRHRLPGARQEHGRHHLHRASREARRRDAAPAPGHRHRAAASAAAATGASPSSDLGTGASAAASRRRRVVLAAGALGSPRLLLKNRRSLPDLSPALGTPLLRQRRRARRSPSTRPAPRSQGRAHTTSAR